MAPFLKDRSMIGGIAGASLGGAAGSILAGGIQKMASNILDKAPSNIAPQQPIAPPSPVPQQTQPFAQTTFDINEFNRQSQASYNQAMQKMAEDNAMFDAEQHAQNANYAAAIEAQRKRLIEESRKTSGGFFGTSGRSALLGNT